MEHIRNLCNFIEQSGYQCQEEEFYQISGTELCYVNGEFLDNISADGSINFGLKKDVIEILLNNSSILSQPYFMNNEVTEGVKSRVVKKLAGYRPPMYERAALFQFSDTKSLPFIVADVKGCGVRKGKSPRLGGSESGVLMLHEAFTELITNKLLNRIFKEDNISNYRTVDHYSIANLKLYPSLKWCGGIPCSTLSREATYRDKNMNELPLAESDLEASKHNLELYLLSKGLTSTGPITTTSIALEDGEFCLRYRGERIPDVNSKDLLKYLLELDTSPPHLFFAENNQIARPEAYGGTLKIVDLGHYRALSDMCGSLVTMVENKPLNFGMMTGLQGVCHALRNKTGCQVDYSSIGPRLFDLNSIPNELAEWLKPTRETRTFISGIVYEAIWISMLTDKGLLHSGEVDNYIDDLVSKVVHS